jgi:putative redox protein
MNDDNVRTVDISRLAKGVYVATNRHGVKMVFGHDNTQMFSPVELMLTAIAGCSGTDIDFITSKRSEPSSFKLRITGDKVRDETGKNHVANISFTVDIDFPDGEEGDAARGVLERAVHQSHDRLCSVSQTIVRGTPIAVTIAGDDART